MRCCLGAVLLALPAAAQPASAAAASPAAALAAQGIALEQQSCSSEGYVPADCARAAQLLERAVQQDPSQIDAAVALSEAHWNRSFEEPKGSPARQALQARSVGTLQTLVDAKVEDARPYYQLSLRKADDVSRRTLLERAVEVRADFAPAHRDLADVYLRTADAAKAAATYQRYQSLRAPSGADGARQDLAFANRLAALNQVAGAQRIVRTAFDQTKDEPRTTRCNVFSKARPEAVEGGLRPQMSTILPACTNDADFKRAVDLQRQGQSDAAIQALQTQVQVNPQHADSYLMLARLYQAKGDTQKAAEIVNRYVGVEADSKERCRRLADPRLREQLAKDAQQKIERDCPQ